MEQTKEKIEKPKEKETLILNGVLALLALICVGIAGWTAVNNMLKGGTDDLFLILTALLLALVFAINPILWAREHGYLDDLFDTGDEAAAEALAHHGESHDHGSTTKENLVTWGALLGLTALEVLLAYVQINLTLMLIIVMGLSIIKAALIIAVFMHLKFERLSFVLTIVPALIVLLTLFAIFFPDSFRVQRLKSYPAGSVHQEMNHR